MHKKRRGQTGAIQCDMNITLETRNILGESHFISIVISVNFLQPVQQLALAPIHFKGVFTPRLFGAVDLKPG